MVLSWPLPERFGKGMTRAMLHLTPIAAAISLCAAMALTGANVALAKAIAAQIPVYIFVVFRFALASGALALMVGGEAGPKLKDMNLRQCADLILMALMGMVGFTVLIFEGLRRTAAADAGIIAATLPAVVAVFGVLFLRDRLQARRVGAVVLAVAGVALVQATGASRGTSTLLGNLMVAGAVVCEASFVILGKRLAPPFRPLRLALGANVAGLLLSLPLGAMQIAHFDPAAIGLGVWGLASWYSLSASVICLWLWYRGLPYVETWFAGLATAAIPVAALAASALMLGETIAPARLAGAALVIAAIVLGAL
jgi:drug/metabolite transporter (DMT)-like permease